MESPKNIPLAWRMNFPLFPSMIPSIQDPNITKMYLDRNITAMIVERYFRDHREATEEGDKILYMRPKSVEIKPVLRKFLIK